MRQKLNNKYRKAAEEFAHRVTSALGDAIDSIVLYGSVARGEAKRDSDIDLLLISPDPETARETASQVCSDFTYEHNYTFFISEVHFSREEFYKLWQLGSPFIANVVKEGVILYDNGTFARVHQQATAGSRRSPQ
jgi:predicted nucleotidyltransferase